MKEVTLVSGLCMYSNTILKIICLVSAMHMRLWS